jgi:hypothetical protein
MIHPGHSPADLGLPVGISGLEGPASSAVRRQSVYRVSLRSRLGPGEQGD